MVNSKVVVIGAGAAGIYATHMLRAKGVDVVCLEASDSVGGRARAYSKNGYICETGALGTEPQWSLSRGLVNEMGLAEEYNFGTTMRVGFWRKNRLNLIGIGSCEQQLRWLKDTLRFRGFSPRAVFQAAKVARALSRDVKAIQSKSTSPEENDFEDFLYLGDTSLADYVLRHGGKQALDGIFAPFMSLMVLGDADKVCVTHMIALLLTSAEGGKEAGGFVWMERGLDSFLRATYEHDSDAYRLSTPVTEVVIKDGAVVGVQTSDAFIEATQVICATTSTVALKIIPDLPETSKDMLRSVRYSSTFNYMICHGKKFTPDEFTMEFLPDTDPKPFFKVLFDSAQRSRSYAPAGATLLHCMTSSAYHERLCKLPDDQREALVIKEAQKIIPRLPDHPDMVEFVRWDDAISLDAPGQIVAVHDYERNHANDVQGLYLAGEYLYPLASTEGAMTSAQKAVNRLLQATVPDSVPAAMASGR